jgi:hypothetical protein
MMGRMKYPVLLERRVNLGGTIVHAERDNGQ